MNIPNIITIFRLILIPIFIITFFSGLRNSLLLAIMIFFTAGFSDVLDGYIARKYNLVTQVGIVLDPLADKMMLITALFCFTISEYIPMWILIVVTCKEAFMIFSGILLYNRNEVIPANKIGKTATILFYLSILILAFDKYLGFCFLCLAVVMAIISLITYFLVYLKLRRTV
jgi:cardiolipin synthase (CMP-forming)